MALHEGLETIVAEGACGKVPDNVPEHRARGARCDRGQVIHLALRSRHAGHRHDHLRRDGRKQGFQEHQEPDTEIARLLDQAHDPVTHGVSSLNARKRGVRSRPK